jgi:hypothetical protein
MLSDQQILSILLIPRQYGPYTIHCDGSVYRNNKLLKTNHSIRRGGKKEIRINLSIDGKKKNWRVHRLVAACFLGPIDGLQVDHDDRNTENNHVMNLSIKTKSQNQLHWRQNERDKNECERS